MAIFVYRKVVNGEAVLLPKLEAEVEKCFPEHQQRITDILTKYNMGHWKVIFHPRGGAFGFCLHGLNIIIISFHRRKEMLITLYHEILHHLHPEWKGRPKRHLCHSNINAKTVRLMNSSRDKERRIDRMAISLYVAGEKSRMKEG